MAHFVHTEIDEEVHEKYSEFKFGNTIQFLLIGYSEKAISIHHKGDKVDHETNEQAWTRMIQQLPNDKALYIVFPLKYTLKAGNGERGKILLISWCPHNSKGKDKMLLACNKGLVKGKLEGVCEEMYHAGGVDELLYEDILQKASKGEAC